MKITAKFCASRRLRFKDTKRIMSPEMRPESFGTFENLRLSRLAYLAAGEFLQMVSLLSLTQLNRPFQDLRSHMSLFCAMLEHEPIEEYFVTETKALLTEVNNIRARKELPSI